MFKIKAIYMQKGIKRTELKKKERERGDGEKVRERDKMRRNKDKQGTRHTSFNIEENHIEPVR